MARYIVSPAAERDIESILAWTDEQFGLQARLRYESLLVCAILDVGDNAQRVGAQTRFEIVANARTYHLYHSRNRVEAVIGRVRNPRHLLLYRVCDDGCVEIGRVLHDSMDLSQHLPDDYRRSGTEETS